MYESMRTVASELSRQLLNDIQLDDSDADDMRRELISVRRDTAQADGYDRHAVDALTAKFAIRLAELQDADA